MTLRPQTAASFDSPTFDSLEPRRLFSTALTSGVNVTGSISTKTEVDSYTISLNAGQTMVVALGEAKSSSYDPWIEVRDPNGKPIKSTFSEVGVFFKLSAPLKGTYTLRVADSGKNDMGSYLLTVFKPGGTMNYGEEGAEGESGRRRAASISAGDLDIWTLKTTKGQFDAITLTENSAGSALDPGVIIFNPDGTIFADQNNEKGLTIEIPHDKTKAGTYTFVVYEAGANDSGRYGISFARLPGAQYTGDPDTITALKPGEKRNGDLPGGDFDIFAIPITAGQKISATLSRSTGSLDPMLVLFGPDGSKITSANGSTSATINATASTTGTYWLLLRDRESDDGGRYDVKYTLS
jgi:hypothetical protein